MGNNTVHMTRKISLRCASGHAQHPKLTSRLFDVALWLVCSLAPFLATMAQAAPNVLPGPTVTKAFNPTHVAVGGTTQMTIVLSNSSVTAINGVQFTDSYPSGMANAPSGAVVSDTCSGMAH